MMACMTHLARSERDALCDTLEAVGPEAPTLCSPWTTADLAAHLVVRERRPDLAAGIWVPLLSGRTTAAMSEYAARPWSELVDLVRSGPPTWSPARVPAVDNAVNLVEFYVHHEDVLRAAAAGPQREVAPRLERGLWSALARLGKVYFRKAGTGVVLIAPDHGRAAVKGPNHLGTVVVQGPPSELVLLAFGRGSVVSVDAQGAPEAVQALMASDLGVA
jgi:uncharacterized protein (TIGR03085 family)